MLFTLHRHGRHDLLGGLSSSSRNVSGRPSRIIANAVRKNAPDFGSDSGQLEFFCQEDSRVKIPACSGAWRRAHHVCCAVSVASDSVTCKMFVELIVANKTEQRHEGDEMHYRCRLTDNEEQGRTRPIYASLVYIMIYRSPCYNQLALICGGHGDCLCICLVVISGLSSVHLSTRPLS